MFMMYLDLAELQDVFQKSRFWSRKWYSPAAFLRTDHLGDSSQPLSESVRDLVESKGHARPQGPIRLLTHLRYFGYLINPVSFYFCFDPDESLQYVVAHVTNTPWGESHSYVVTPEQFASAKGRVGFDDSEPRDSDSRSSDASIDRTTEKNFHVSPFLPMEMSYGWVLKAPSKNLNVHIENYSSQTVDSRRKTRRAGADERVSAGCVTDLGDASESSSSKKLDVTLSLTRREISSWALSSTLLKYPLMTIKVVAAIYWQAVRIWIKGAKFYSHPKSFENTRLTAAEGDVESAKRSATSSSVASDTANAVGIE